MTRWHVRTLAALWQAGDGATYREVARVAGFRLSNVYQTIPELERLGYVSRGAKFSTRTLCCTAIPVYEGIPARIVEWIPLGRGRVAA